MNHKGGYQRPFTLNERKIIQSLLAVGKTGGEIAKALNRSKTGTNFEIRKHGGRRSYDAVQAHNAAVKANNERIEKLRVKNKKKPESLGIRVEALEMQINIIKETLKGLLYGKN